MASRATVVNWLLEGDPAIRWQVMRDLMQEPADIVAAERSRVTEEGWGASLLQLQSPDGHWGDDQDHGWMTTMDVLTRLMELGADPAGEKVKQAVNLVRARVFWWQLDGQAFFEGETEPCINGRILAAGAYFGAASEKLLARLLGEQLEDGGWNCEAPPSKRSSFHSTICVLDGLIAYEAANGPTPAVAAARSRAEEYLLERRLIKSLRSGEMINPRWTQFAFPATWHYDVLRSLDYMRGAGIKPDERLSEAVSIVEQKRDADGRWPLDAIQSDPRIVVPDMERDVGKASRWNTMRALRVLDRYGA